MAEENRPTIMVNIQPGHSNAGLLQVAAGVAATLNALVVGIAAWQPTPVDWTCGDYVPENFPGPERREADTATRGAEAEFRKTFPGDEPAWHCSVSFSPPHAYIVHQMRGADLVLTGTPSFHESRAEHTVAGDIVMQTGRPVLVVPGALGTPVLDRVMLAWKDRRHTRRAVLKALPLLQRASQVTVVEVAREDDLLAAHDQVACVGRWLAKHGIMAHTVVARSDGDDAGQLRALARSHAANLIVAGAYGHGRFREWMFGGVTRALLIQDDCCAFLSH